ncbi:MAG TPA: DUF6531 domain-containing protein [Burkholderiaceae bacterium]|jgi:YD repeat-containing protein|nr:DUF6531 domain-containing protein [Burkholderiaceae bacterium]
MKRLFFLSVVLAAPALALAGVSVQNGNFYITYEDVTHTQGEPAFSLRRTYNSLSPERGWLGVGWGTPYETRLVVMPDGTTAVVENGSGSVSYYRPETPVDTAAGAMRLAEAIAARDKLAAEAVPVLRDTLAGDDSLRLRKVREYGVRSELSVGAVLRDPRCPEAAVTRTADGYRRTTCARAVDDFDAQGRLVRRDSGDGQRIVLHYDDARPTRITDAHGRTLHLAWNADGLLSTLRSDDGRHAVYRYNTAGDLVESIDVHGSPLRYSYDDNHNLTEIRYIDTTTMQIVYGVPRIGRVASVTERTGERTEYTYTDDPVNGAIAAASIRTIDRDGHAQVRHVAFDRVRTDAGGLQMAAVSTMGDHGRGRLDTRYDAQGRLVHRADGQGGSADYVYHPRTGKLIMALGSKTQRIFRYDDCGRLIRADSSDGRQIELAYHPGSRQIARMVERQGEAAPRELTFRYNAAGKPTQIQLVGTGTIHVRYDARGEIEHVEAPRGGTRTALQVTQAFSTLLQVVKIAGVDAPF